MSGFFEGRAKAFQWVRTPFFTILYFLLDLGAVLLEDVEELFVLGTGDFFVEDKASAEPLELLVHFAELGLQRGGNLFLLAEFLFQHLVKALLDEGGH